MKFIPVVAVLLVTACASTPAIVPDATDADSLSTLSLSCKKPYQLTQDCSGFSGATRKISIDGFDAKIAGSAAGDIVLVMDAHLMANSFKDFATLNSPSHSRSSNDSYSVVRRVLDKHAIAVTRVRPVRSLGNIDGYLLELQGDGYSVLKRSTTE